ncbi:MAG: F0F1 ATP synthase subunit epsilon [Bacteroidaceae bacterium]|nr:F0F1 ATP synthase subunit epsilon [Bacteroidaceae bacterium]
MFLRIITPQGVKYDGQVTHVRFPAVKGLMEILDGHAPMIAAVCEGEVTVDDDVIEIGGGVLKVENNKVTIVCE